MAVYVWEITACVSNEYTELLLPLAHMSGYPIKAKETGLECCLNNSLSYARSVEILDPDITTLWHDSEIFTEANVFFAQCAMLHGHKYTFI